jgi:hypothetical protein
MTPEDQQQYWVALLRYMKKDGLLRKQREPYRGNRQVIDDWLGGSVRLAAGLNSEERWIHVDITFAGEFRLGRYNYFEVKREKFQEAVEHAMGDLYDASCSWTWNKHEDPHRGESHIILRKAGVDPNDGTDRLQQYEWLSRTASAFRDAFGAIPDKW